MPVSTRPPIRSVLFDLDGTLLDTAPDLVWALNHVREEEGLQALPLERIRPAVSHGSIALIRHGFECEPEHPRFAARRQRLLDVYRENLARHTRPFPGMERLLDELEARGIRWGVVTNKPSWLTEPLLQQLGLLARAAVVVSGDTLAERKPHPAPILYACRETGAAPANCLYIGDAERDIRSGRNAGVHTLVALFGYLGPDDDPRSWGADGLVAKPDEIRDWVVGP
ncbi:HAD family hydrolase [Thiohalobacter sp. IOR34]|uniref:HAD family hydrolase n=1 Tax=Thiohalobacter sp. IOR34 TaxID=3057176 RepID=UPI0025AF5C48|nr:HAD family hydrolase [Thiohalobacter sp. IOR34]WJW76659.1 HAD family hydrolase [Thiohalobacter sp. IOR34]